MARRKPRPAVASANEQVRQSLERYRWLLSPEDLARLLDELDRPLLPGLRANPLKVEPQTAIENWAIQYGWKVRRVPFCRYGWQIMESSTPPSQTIEHRLGDYYLQDAASMLPVELFDFPDFCEKGEPMLALDLAASPGGKSTHLNARMDDRGLLIANDASRSRITALRLVLQTWGASNSAVTHFPGERFGGWYPEVFDRVLLDAPCSMQGLRTSPSHPLRPISAREQQALAERQRKLLESAFQALKTGGQLVYSTCTLEPQEDEAVVDWLARRYPGAVQVDDLSARLPQAAPGLSAFGSEVFLPAVQLSARIWPHIYGTAGFFAARISKAESVPMTPQSPPARPFERSLFMRLSSKRCAQLAEFFASGYGFDLRAELGRQGLELYQRDTWVYALPLAYLSRLADLPCESLGLPVGEDGPEGFVISHDWTSRFGRKFSGGKAVIPDEEVNAWLRGEDIQHLLADCQPGEVVILFDAGGRLLGRGKVQAQRIKNLLPRRLVIQ